MERNIRVLIAKPGLDGHDRGAKVIARALRDAGMEVIYTGLRQTSEMIRQCRRARGCGRGGGCPSSQGRHMHYFKEIMEGLKARGAEDIIVFGGGIVPDQDLPKLKEMGVAAIFTAGSKYARGGQVFRGDGAGTAGARGLNCIIICSFRNPLNALENGFSFLVHGQMLYPGLFYTVCRKYLQLIARGQI